MSFKQIILNLLEASLDNNNKYNVVISDDLWNEIYSIMLLLERIYGPNETKAILNAVK